MIYLNDAKALLNTVLFEALAAHLTLAFMHWRNAPIANLKLSGSSASFIQLTCMLALVD